MLAHHPFLTGPVRKWLRTDYRSYPDRLRIEAIEEVLREWARSSQLRDGQVQRCEMRLDRLEMQIGLCDEADVAALCAEAGEAIRQSQLARAAFSGFIEDGGDAA